jgi:MiaB-like tRNA modifying enzyme
MQSGLQITNNPDIADFLIINTCIVKEPTEKKIERRIQDLQKKYAKKPIIIAGCMPELRKFKEKNIYLLGIHHVKDICKLIRKILEHNYNEKEFLGKRDEEKLLTGKISRIKGIGITQISEGCLGNCSFCITKLAKGKLFSYPEDNIIKNIQQDLKSGCKEIWLTSQDNAAYSLDSGASKLPELMNKILNLKGKFQIRLGMMNPENILLILNKLIDIYKNKKMKKFLHLPLQSGSNKILKLMNRKYKVEDWLRIVQEFRKEIPDLFLSTDIIVGFPEETEQDFQASLKILQEIKPQQLNISKFWTRKRTDAEKMKQLPKEVAKRRIKILADLFKEIKSQEI